MAQGSGAWGEAEEVVAIRTVAMQEHHKLFRPAAAGGQARAVE
jgi:hypothetical protein